jgi:hypothetical protein
MVPAHVKRVLFSLICFLGHNDDAWEISFLYIPIHKGTHFALYLCVLRAAERRIPPSQRLLAATDRYQIIMMMRDE